VKPAVLAKGYLYILPNPAMPDLLKIGLTTRKVPDRIAELSAATGVPSAFTVEAYFESSAPQQYEKTVHRKLQKRRVAGKEFFRVRLDEAVESTRAVTGNLPLGNPRQLSEDEQAMMDLRDHIIASTVRLRLFAGAAHVIRLFRSTGDFKLSAVTREVLMASYTQPPTHSIH